MKKYIIASSITFLTFVSIVGAQNFTFSKDLSVGVSGNDVIELQSWLISNGYDIPALSSGAASHGYFGAQTKVALMKYQMANGIPNTGYFGPMTRGRMNEWRPTDGRSPVINGIDAPTVLNVGETGTWNVRATDPQNGTLSYSVDWGDNVGYSAVACPVGYVCTPISGAVSTPMIQQGSTFTHSYSNTGNYIVKFTVKNNLGLIAKSSVTIKVGTNVASPLNIISPNGGEVWQRGTTQTIRWNAPYYFRATYADLRLVPYYQPCTGPVCPMGATQSSGAQTSMMYPYRASLMIVPNISINQNSYTWKVGDAYPVSSTGELLVGCGLPNNPCAPDGQYTIQICETGTDNCDSSNSPFTITSPTPLSVLKVTSPNGGEVWQANSAHQISWSITNLANTNSPLDIYLDSVNIYTNCLIAPCPMIATRVPYVLDKNILASTVYNWIVATDINNAAIPAGNYTVRVCLAGSTENCDSSDNSFTISY